MGRSRNGSIGSYSSGSAGREDVLSKYGAHQTGEKIKKLEKDIAEADKGAQKRARKLEKSAAAQKAEDLAKIDGDGDDASDGNSSSDLDSQDAGYGNIASDLAKLTPEEVFAQFDTDDSGLIDFDEFRAMLPRLGIKISMPKALRYFRMCDSDGSGEVDLDEFKVALFAVDPDNGNPVGFTPNALLTPLDAFEMFDEDKSGKIDEDEFFFLLQFLGLEVSEVKLEQLFSKYDSDKSGFIEYAEFKKIWVRLANVKKELTDRGIKIPKLATSSMLSNMLEQILDAEEDRERRAIAEAERWAKWQFLLKDKRRAYEKARRRTTSELKSALDAGGSVWVFGTGPFGEFTSEAPQVLKQGEHEFAHYDVVRDSDETAMSPEGSTDHSGEIEDGVLTDNQDNHIDPEEDARTSPFAGLCVAQSTAALWGRRISSVTTSDSAAFAISEQGEGYTWGGKDHWWFEIRPDSYWQTHWRGATTERSRLLLQTTKQEEPDEAAAEVDVDEEEKEIEKLMTLTQYYGVWKPPPTNHRLHYIQHELMPKITHPQVKYSLQCRGKHVEDMNKADLLELLFDDIVLEKKVLGERQHRRIRQLELETLHMYEKKKSIMGKSLRLEIEEMWTPLREIQAEDAAIKRANEAAGLDNEYAIAEERYSMWREHIRRARDETRPLFTPRGNGLQIGLGGVTERAGDLHTPRANDAAVAISAGANHVLLVHRSGQLYTWGVGASGRLGLDLTQGGNPQADAPAAAVIQAFVGRPIIRASAAYSHSGAITSSGGVYTWGSAATGKLGLGHVDRDVYCSVPTRVMVDSTSKVKEISCGAAHTACATASGQLFVWGCGDGGRLGLGEERLGPQYEPVLVDALSSAGERIASVSCGNSHTLALTAIREGPSGEAPGRTKVKAGGSIYQAGSTNVLGMFCPSFVLVQGLEDVMVRQVSAGYGHSCCCTLDGELYAWGSNRDGCLGLPRPTKFASQPQLVTCLYVSPSNLALGRPTRQSSVFDNLGAGNAVDGDRAGDDYRKCSCTQQDPQGWWEVDMGQLVHIHQVKVWNRCDQPSDPSMDCDFYAKRLFPCWVMASQQPFSDEVGGAALLDAMNVAVARAHFKEENRCSVWTCPDQTMARFVRVQLEGFDFLHVAQVEVYGTTGARRAPGRVTHCCAGKYVTTAVMAAAEDPRDVDLVYRKAVQADAFNAEVLRELETFFGAYDQWGRGDAIKGCLLCRVGSLCEICALKHEFRDELRDLPLGPGGSLQPLEKIARYLFDKEKPTLNYASPIKKGTGVISTVRGTVKSLLAPLQGSAGDSQSASTTTTPDHTTVSNDKPPRGKVFGPKRRAGADARGKRAGGAISEDGTLSSSSASGGTAGAGVKTIDTDYHVGPLVDDLSSSRTSTSVSTTSTYITSSTSSTTTAGSSGGGSSTESVVARKKGRPVDGTGGDSSVSASVSTGVSGSSGDSVTGASSASVTTLSGTTSGFPVHRKGRGAKQRNSSPRQVVRAASSGDGIDGTKSRGQAVARTLTKKRLRVSAAG